MVNCAVPSCKNDSRRQTKQNSNVTFHRFPKNEDLLRKWVDALQRPDWEPTIRSFVCSTHFAESSMYFSKSGLRKLVQDAVPEKALENVEQPKHKTKQKRKSSKVIVSHMYVDHSPDDSRKKKVKKVRSNSLKDKEASQSDCPIKRKLKKRIINLTKLSKRRRLRCNALYASLNRIRKKVSSMTKTLKDLQSKMSTNSELSSALESCGVSTTELFKGVWKKEKSCSPEPQDEEEYFYSDIPDDIENYIQNHIAPKQKITVYSTSLPAHDFVESPPEMDVQVSVVKTESSSPRAEDPVFVDPDVVCRVCLLSNVQMLPIEEELREVYEKLAGTTLDITPRSLCHVCVASLQRCQRFAEMSQKAEQYHSENKCFMHLCINAKEMPIGLTDTDVLKDISIVEVPSKFARTYNNPYHPEDDLIAGDSNDYSQPEEFRSGKLSDYETIHFDSKRLKVNGKYFDNE